MSETVAAALKKVAASLLSNPKALKAAGGIVIGVIVIIVMPIAATIAVFNSDIEIDTQQFQQKVVGNLSAEEQEMLQKVEDTMFSVETEMTAAGLGKRVKEAQAIYMLALFDDANEPSFVSKLVGCFSAEQTDEQLIHAVNAKFGTELAVQEFRQIMKNIRDTASK